MANKIKDLTTATDLTGEDLFPIWDVSDQDTRKVTFDDLADKIIDQFPASGFAFQTTNRIITVIGQQTYALDYDPGDNDLFVTLNGQRIFKSSPGSPRDYTISGETITLVDPVVAVGDLDYTGGRFLADLTTGLASVIKNYVYIATAGQTVFTGVDSNGRTLSYLPGNEIVTLNGSDLVGGSDYSATSGTSVILASGATAGDVVKVTAFSALLFVGDSATVPIILQDANGAMVGASSNPGGNEWLYTVFPAVGGAGNLVLGPGSGGPTAASNPATTILNRVTSLGAVNLVAPVSVDRTEAIGQGAMRWTRYGERNTALGTLAMQWGGFNPTLDIMGRSFNHDILYNGGVTIDNPAWDFEGLETSSPGTRATIIAWRDTAPWATARTDFARNVAVGRDAACQMALGIGNTNVGYRAGTCTLEADENSNFGMDAGHRNMFGEGNANVGYRAGYNNQYGDNNTSIGREALQDFVSANRNVGVGYRAGYGCNGGDNNVYIGPYAGNQDAAASHTSRLYVQDGVTGFIVGDMASGKIGIGPGMVFDNIKADILHLLRNGPVGGVLPNVSARGLVIEDGTSDTGVTIKTLGTQTGAVYFADEADNNPGAIVYRHDTDELYLKAGDVTNLRLGLNTMGFYGATPAAKPTGVAVTAAGIHAALTSLGLIT